MADGGLSPEQPANENVQALCNKVKPDILRACDTDNFEVLKALRYRSQVVAGTNYFVKILITDRGGCVHVRIFEGLDDGGTSLDGIEKGKTIDDPINHIPVNL